MIPRIITTSPEEEMRRLGCDPAGIKIMSDKADFKVIKLSTIKPIPANIIKQEILSLGGEAATSYGVIDHSAKQSDVLIFGTLRQLNQLVNKLKQHQFGLPAIALEISTVLKNYAENDRKVKVMGILNVTPDSFSDGGKYFNLETAVKKADEMIAEGAEIIDIGGESTRPGATAVPAKAEIDRVLPIIKKLAKHKKVVVSIDTRKAEVAKAALEAGAKMVNDVSGLRFDKKMAGVAAKYQVPVCLMHMRGTPANMQQKTKYHDLMGELAGHLEEGLAIAKNAGILHEKIIVDPGLGFSKTADQNLEILRRLRELKGLGCPVLLGPSRKATIGQVLGLPVKERLEGTLAMVAVAVINGVDIVRVHDVKETIRVVRMVEAIKGRR
ncbi:MAG: dihydropteroate synthase [bacterium]